LKLISESVNSRVEVLTETTNGKKALYIEGVYAQAGIKNGNNRIYPSKVLIPEAKRYTKEAVDTGRALGELDHPEGPRINLDRVSHRIVSMKVEGDNVVGKSVVLDTTAGNILRGIIEGGGNVGVSTRGLGSVRESESGVQEIQKDFKLFAVDVVANPSAPDAYVNGVMESVDWLVENGIIVKRDASKIIKAEGQDRIRLFRRLLKALS